MESKIAGIELSLWCKEERGMCSSLNCTMGPRCMHFNKPLEVDNRMHKDGTPLRLDKCLAVDLEGPDPDDRIRELHFNPADFEEDVDVVELTEGITKEDVIE